MSLLEQFQDNEDRVTAYLEWINQPIAHEVLNVIRETFCRPQVSDILDAITKEAGSHLLGRYAGNWQILDALTSLNGYTPQPAFSLEPTYGAEGIRNREGTNDGKE